MTLILLRNGLILPSNRQFNPGRNHYPPSMKKVFTWLFFTFSFCYSYSQVTIIPFGSTWKYLANGSDQGTAWRASSFTETGWSTGASELGYGDGDEATCVTSGGGGTVCLPSGNKYITTYFRKSLTISNPTSYANFTFRVKRDDGFVLYLNGSEIHRNNMPASPTAIGYLTTASSNVEDEYVSFNVASASFNNGNNVIAVEMHQGGATSSDISFNLQLVGHDAFSTTLARGPYLQMANETAITIRWRTSGNQNSRIELGTSFGTYPTVVSDAANVTEHVVRVTGLTADTKYYYRIGNSTNMGTADADKYFTTVPPANTTRKIRIAAFGDCGRNSSTYQDQTLANYKDYLSDIGVDAPDAWILMGDNAYSSGTDAEYTNNFFNIYDNTLLKNHKLYPSPGNHDYGNSTGNKPSRTMPYYNTFTTPKLGECGGVASNKPNFYSFDIGNIHFLSLDSWGTEADLTHMGTSGSSTLKTWINNDLAANTKKWTIAYWHHPPYTKTSHDSDTESELQAIRQNFITYLEARGVDLIINGHSHGYERGYMLKNYTGAWSSFSSATHAVSTSSAAYTSSATCPYVYNSSPLNHGTVYVVAGSAGASGGIKAEFDTGPMPFSVNDAGVLYFEVEGNRLDAKMLRRNGTVFDEFTIIKDVNQSTSYNVIAGNNVTLTASWPGDHTWSTGASTRSINFTPASIGSTNFTVTDDFGCITDQFSVIASSTLPVSLLGFDVNLQANGKVKLTWSTAMESNNKYFTVERSENGSDYVLVGTVNGAGNSSIKKDYLFIDESPLPGTSYYRLSQTDIDSKMQYLGVKRIANNKKSFEIKTLSTTSGVLSLQISSINAAQGHFRVFDMNGRERKNEKMAINPGISRKDIQLPSGIYIWEMQHEKGETVFQKVIIQ
jgi:hypothetical protein